MSCDVFGTIIGSQLDARAVGQSFTQMSDSIDYICPMVYPSHYSSGNFGLDHPDLQPYETIVGALGRAKRELAKTHIEGQHQAGVRPWLQAFTATWLGSGNYMNYDSAAIRKQIQGVYDAGYDEWILWSASVSYDYDGFLSESEAEQEWSRIEESRAAVPEEEEEADPEETFPVELEEALVNGELSDADKEILLQDGPILVVE